MTRLEKAVIRETMVRDDRTRRPLVVKLEGPSLLFRWKGTRRWYSVPLRAIITLGYGIAAQELKAARDKAKSERRRKS